MVVFPCEFQSSVMSAKLTLAKIQPRKLVLVQNDGETYKSLIDYCKNNLAIEEIIIANESVQLIPSMSIHPIKLSEEFYNSLKFLRVDEYEVAFLHGEVKVENEQLHFSNIDCEPRSFGYFLGIVRLGHIRNLLIEKGYRAEFREGKLVINDRVIIYKQGSSGSIQDYTIEGVMSKEYFEIRKIIYSQHIYV